MPDYLRQQLRANEDIANIGFFYRFLITISISVAIWALRRGERTSLTADLRQRSINYDNFTTLSVLDSLLFIGTICICVWALVALTIFVT